MPGAEAATADLFRPADWDELLFTAAAPSLWRAFAESAIDEHEATTAAVLLAQARSAGKSAGPSTIRRTTAQDAIERYDLTPPDEIATEAPEWVLNEGTAALRETFQEPYWTRVNQTTRDDIETILNGGLAEGHSVRTIARSIRDLGAGYSIWRGKMVARTETGGAANAGHMAGMRQVGIETGEQMGKEWVSVLGSTTRPTHATADGQQVDVDGDFEVGGHKAPYPSHHSLPAKERVHCQCTIVSVFLVDAAVAPGEPIPIELDRPVMLPRVLTDEEIDSMHVSDIMAVHAPLIEKQEKVAKLAKQARKERDKANQAMRVATVQLEDAMLRIDASNRLVRERGGLDLLTEAELLARSAANQDFVAKDAALRAAVDRVKRLGEVERAKVVKIIAPPKKERVKFKPHALRFGPSAVDVSTDGGKEVMRKAGEASGFLSDVTGKRMMGSGGLDVLENVEFQTKGVRAHYESSGGGSVNCGPQDGVEVYVHEMGHHIEDKTVGAVGRSGQFLSRRIAESGKPDIHLKDLSDFYEDGEVGNSDGFMKAFDRSWIPSSPDERYVDPPDPKKGDVLGSDAMHAIYTGKRYTAGPGGTGPLLASEAVSMGVQLLYSDPIGFAERDPEYFKFTVGVLDGSFR